MSKKSAKRRRKNFTEDTLSRREGFKYKLIAEGIGVGFLAGLIVSLFRLALTKAESARDLFIDSAGQKFTLALLGAGLLVFIAVCTYAVIIREPLSSGSGIPQVKGELQGQINANWVQVIIAKFLGGILAIGGGLSLGREGPSIQIGAMVGKGFSRINNRLRTEEKLLMTCGSGAGLAAAFGAPLAGVVFALEELHKNFSQEVLLSTMASAITGDCIGSYIFGLEPVLDFEINVDEGLPLNRMWMVIVLGLILGVFGVLFNKTILIAQDCFKRLKLKWIKVFVPFAIALLLAIWLPEALGSGHKLIGLAGEGAMTVKVLVTLLAVKYVFSVVSFGSGVPGGIFLPLLVIGALTGGIFTEAISPIAGYEQNYIQYFVILGMTGYFSAIVRAPITGVILISEMTGTFSNLLSLSAIALTSYMTADVLKGRPIYDELMERIVAHGKVRKPKVSNKVLVEGEIHYGAYMDSRPLSDIMLPQGCLVVSIQRGSREIVPSGDTVLNGGDKLVILCDEGIVPEVHRELDEKCKSIFKN